MKVKTFLRGVGASVLALGLASCSSVNDEEILMSGSHYAHNKMAPGRVETAGLGEHDSLQSEKAAQKAPVNQSYYFAFDDSTIAERDYDGIAAQSQYLAKHPNAHVRLEGNTDERGSREYNLALGERRARSVAELLQLQGVRPDQIDLISNGQEKPVALGHNEEAHRINRRVDLVFEVY